VSEPSNDKNARYNVLAERYQFLIRSLLRGVTLIVVSLVGYNFSQMLADGRELSDLNRTVVDLMHREELFETEMHTWRDGQGRYDSEIRAEQRAEMLNYNDAIRQINNRINEVALRVGGGTVPPRP
jgi:hypothetical protein